MKINQYLLLLTDDYTSTMKLIFLILAAFSLHAEFTILDDPKIEAFEKDLAFYFNVSHPEPVITNYISALSMLENHGINHPSLKSFMVPFLVSAYTSIAFQRNWQFDISKAAELEYEIIVGNAKGENISRKQIELYQLIYHSTDFAIEKAVIIRSFIYQYKIKVLKEERVLSIEEMDMLLRLARLSESFLNSLEANLSEDPSL